MSELQDMTGHDTAAATDFGSRGPVKESYVADSNTTTETTSVNGDKPTVIRILDPKTEHTRDAWHDMKAAANNLFLTARYHSIRALPAWLVNNSTNILGATHVATEMMMFKASSAEAKLIQNPGNPLNWVYEPLKNVFEGTFKAAGIQHTNDKTLLPATDNRAHYAYKLIQDTDLATKREIKRLEEKQISDFTKKGLAKGADAVDPLRRKFSEKLALGKDEYADQLTLELEKMNKTQRAATVKTIEGELQQISGGPVYSNMRLSNPWQMRSTFAGLLVWALSAVIPDKKETDAEVERMAVLRATNLPKYIGERFKEAVWVPQWPSHKRQMIGLGIMTSGICSLLGSWRNRKTLLTDAKAVVEFAGLLDKKGLLETGATGTIDKLVNNKGNEVMKSMRYAYEFNISYFATSMLTFLSSLPLLFATDNERGFSGFGTLMTGRLAFLPSSIGKKIRDKEPGVGFYTAGMASFQAENWAQALAGGAQKRKDPRTGIETVVDHDAERKAAKEKAAEIKIHKEQKDEQREPTHIVTYVSDHEMAMPQHLDAHEQQKVAAAV